MLDIMYDAPSDPSIREIVISKDVIAGTEQPLIVQHPKEAMAG
jgi:ATP-dependent protease Clp ATPase subunit